MAKVLYGEMISDMRGKLNGTVHSKNRSGQYMRTKVSPVNPQTSFQANVRSSFAFFTQNWRALTAAQRASWNAVVDQFQKINVFGKSFKVTGANLYIGLNRNIATIAGTAITSPPTPSTVTAVTSMSAVADVSDATIVLTYAPAIPAGQKLALFATAAHSAGIYFVKNKLRLIGYLVTANASPYDITSLYEAKFGTGWKSAGLVLDIEAKPIVTASGIAAPVFSTRTTVQA